MAFSQLSRSPLVDGDAGPESVEVMRNFSAALSTPRPDEACLPEEAHDAALDRRVPGPCDN